MKMGCGRSGWRGVSRVWDVVGVRGGGGWGQDKYEI